MKRLTTLFLGVAGAVSIGLAKPDTLWTRTYGGIDADRCHSAHLTSDGGCMLAGETWSYGAGGADFWLVKTDASGDTLWARTFGGFADEYCHSVRPTTDGGCIAAGQTESFGAGQIDFWAVRTDADGDTVWTRTFGGSGCELCQSVQQTTDGGFILAGCTWTFGAGSGDFWLVKTDANGDTAWTRTFGGGSEDYCYSVQQTSDGGYVLAGYTRSFGAGSLDFWMVKTDASGDALWTRSFGGANIDACAAVQQTADSGYVMAGRTNSYGAGNYDFWLVRCDAAGDTLWTRTFGGILSDQCKAVQQTIDGGFVLAGQTESFGAGESDFWMVKTDPDGNLAWDRMAGGTLGECCFTVQQTSDSGYIQAGETYSYGAGWYDFWLVRCEADPCDDPTPAAPDDVVLVNEGNNVRLSWSPVTTNVNGCSLVDTVNAYLVWYSSEDNGDFEHHCHTTGTTCVHYDVIASEAAQFYQVEAYNGPPLLLRENPIGVSMTHGEVRRVLNR